MLVAGGAGQTLTGGAGQDVLIGAAAGGNLFADTVAGLGDDYIRNFATAGDRIDLTDLAFGAGSTLGFVEDASGSFGTLSIQNGAQSTSVTLFGQFSAANFAATSDGAAGTLIAYQPTPATPVITMPH